MTVAIEGMAELQRAFKLAGDSIDKGLKTKLVAVAEPVRREAERLAVSEIRNVAPGDPWAQMRAVARTSLVYVAPQERGRRSRANPALRRPNMARLLLKRAMEPALERKRAEVLVGVEDLIGRMAGTWARG